jgi:ABC-2 type transport system ATP-binding protein
VTLEHLDAADRKAATSAGLEVGPVSLQQLIVGKTSIPETEFGDQQ